MRLAPDQWIAGSADLHPAAGRPMSATQAWKIVLVRGPNQQPPPPRLPADLTTAPNLFMVLAERTFICQHEMALRKAFQHVLSAVFQDTCRQCPVRNM